MPSPCAEIRRARPLLGTFVEITIGEGGQDDAIAAGFAAIEEVQRRMSFHDPESTLSRLNREGARHPVPLDPLTLIVLRAARTLHQRSGGVFDLNVASRLQAAGFLPANGSAKSGGTFADVEITDDCARFHHPGVQLDLGGIAKGFAVDHAVDILQKAGVRQGLVNAGGDLRAFGDSPYPISIRHPANPGATLMTLPLRDGALATSAHYFTDRLAPGTSRGPFVDPRPGQIPSPLPRSVTVRAESAMMADGLTKIVMLAAEMAPPLLEELRASALFVSTEGEIVCTENWNAAFNLPT